MKVLILVGSESDRPTLEPALEGLKGAGVQADFKVSSAHRQPEQTAELARTARERGYGVVICGAGLSAALPGVVAAHTDLPVIGVPVACVGIGNAKNAAHLALRILGVKPTQ